MKITVHNRQTRCRPNASKLAALARFFMGRAGRRWDEVSVVLTDDAGIAPVNRVFLDHPFATDVIAFILPPLPGARKAAAELHINVQRAMEEGTRRGSASHELALYLAHGCDHVMGAEDGTLAERRRMRRRELFWIRRARTQGLMKGLCAAT